MRVTCLLQRGRAPAACRARNRVARSLRFFLRARPRRLVINPLCRRWCVYEAGGPQSVFCSRGDAGGGGPVGRHRRARTAEPCLTPGASWVGVPKAPPLGVAGACGGSEVSGKGQRTLLAVALEGRASRRRGARWGCGASASCPPAPLCLAVRFLFSYSAPHGRRVAASSAAVFTARGKEKAEPVTSVCHFA